MRWIAEAIEPLGAARDDVAENFTITTDGRTAVGALDDIASQV